MTDRPEHPNREFKTSALHVEFDKDKAIVGTCNVLELMDFLQAWIEARFDSPIEGFVGLGVAIGSLMSGCPIGREGLREVFNVGLQTAFDNTLDHGAELASVQSVRAVPDSDFDFQDMLKPSSTKPTPTNGDSK